MVGQGFFGFAEKFVMLRILEFVAELNIPSFNFFDKRFREFFAGKDFKKWETDENEQDWGFHEWIKNYAN